MSSPPDASPRPLEPADFEAINEGLVRAYTVEALSQRLGYKLGLRPAYEIDTTGGSRQVFDRLINWADSEGRARDILAVAWSGKPGNGTLAAAAQRVLTPAEQAWAMDLYGQGKLPPREASLEAAVTARSRLFDFDAFLSRYKSVGDAICKVETPAMTGTGFLVGRSSVLTNFHVIEQAKQNGLLGEQITCRFDVHSARLKDDPDGDPVALRTDWLAASSPYSASDISGRDAPSAAELDFALLRLAGPVAAERSALPFPAKPPSVRPGDIAMIAQHPGGQPLSIAYGSVTDFPASGLRYRYDVTTEPGSSGAPVFSADLDLIGLHHAADPQSNPRYNQAIPLYLVARAIRAANIDMATL